ncbi:MAG: hypothetical protein ISR58_00700 [Anaerolineales bacterium]|nr:hypothetical protein [Chloroflexota bacterium]MBL6979682.1 hypothetical protein [Anaerolineales bacterium]
MNNSQTPYFKGAIWLGLVVLIPITALLFSSLRAEPEAPRWIVILFLMMFFNAGLTLVLLDSLFNEVREDLWFAYFQALVLLSIPLLFAILLNWVAFGPGEREFSGGVSIPFLSFSFERANTILGRLIFGIPALLMDVFIGIVIAAVVKTMFGNGEEKK